MRLPLIFAISLSAPNFAFAQAGKISATTGFLQIFLALAFVIALMLVGAWLFKRIGPIANAHQLQLKVVGGLNIGNREKVMVVEVGDQWLILGVTPQNINTLGTLPKQELAANDRGTGAPQNQFSDWLKKTLDKRSTPQP